MAFNDDLASSPGIGPLRAELLHKLGIHTRTDLLFHLPHRYEDRRRFVPLSTAMDGDIIAWRGKIAKAKSTRWRGGRLVFELVAAPEHPHSKDDILTCRWFNVHYLPKILIEGKDIIVHGKLVKGKKGWVMIHPEFELVDYEGEEFVHLNRITPIYPLTEGLSQRVMRRVMYDATQVKNFQYDEYYPAPPSLPPLRLAIPTVHFPENYADRDAARRRIVYDEFFLLQCILARRRLSREKIHKPRPEARPHLARDFIAQLPFVATGAQNRVIGEIEADLHLPIPMNRLLQGDVGAGKTIVAVYALLLAVGEGKQAGIMAPTEILAEQHYLNLRRWLEPLGVSIGLFTGSRKQKVAEPIGDALPGLASEGGSIVVGTHALLYDSYAANDLGLIVIDEQHKFGVLQRLALAKKGQNPDVLVMTATPIPRTLGMTLYGDLDVSVLDEMPPGRQKIVTAVRSPKEAAKAWKFMAEQIALGRQAYVVYPLIEESEKIDAKAVQKEYERIKTEFPKLNVGLLHGRMRPQEKEAVMTDFRSGKVQVLVCTPVIEVGVDVPNATIMIIENAERFGLAQLHQLRGRIGRGSEKSYCVLIGEPKSKESWRRLKIMEETNDGFRIADEDLKIRGPGNMFGTEQSGLPPLRWADLFADADLLAQARQDAEKIIRADPTLQKFPDLRDMLDNSGSSQTLAAVS